MNAFKEFRDNEDSLLDDINNIKYLLLNNLRTISISSFIILFLTILHLFITPKEYISHAKIQILEENETSAFVLDGMMEFNAPFKAAEILENEIQVLKSKDLLEKVIADLNLNHYYKEVLFLKNKLLDHQSIPFIIKTTNPLIGDEYELDFSVENNNIIHYNNISKPFIFGKSVVLEGDSITIIKSDYYKKEDIYGKKYLFGIHNSYSTFLSLQARLKFSAITDMILQISIKGKDPLLNERLINSLLANYTNDNNNNNNAISQSTKIFLSERISLLKADISLLEGALSSIKKGNNIFDISAVNSIFSDQKLASNEMTFEIETQEMLAKSFLNTLKEYKTNQLLPLPIEVGITSSELSSFTNEFNNLVIERNKLLKGRTANNPEIKSIDEQLKNLLSNLNLSINNYISNLHLKRNKIDKYDKNIEAKFYQLNDTEISIVKLTREIDVKASILLFLLEKQEETFLTLAVAAPTFKSLEAPHTNYQNTTPNSFNYLLFGFLLSLLLPLGFVYVRALFYDKITDKESLLKKLNKNIPILGEIPFSNEQIISKKTRGTLLESFRLIRTNLNYLLANNNNNSKTILVTSSILKEGKTFTAINLAQSLRSINNSKVLVIGLDLRNPQIHKFLQIDKDTNVGVTNYLTNNVKDINLLINQHQSVDFDFILSGPIPPNPAELLLSERLDDIIEFARNNYDYVILDTAPCLLVADTLNIFKYADTTIYLTRSKYTKLKIVDYINQLTEDGLIKNPAIVLNGLENQSNGYGYNYGYGYGYKNEN